MYNQLLFPYSRHCMIRIEVFQYKNAHTASNSRIEVVAIKGRKFTSSRHICISRLITSSSEMHICKENLTILGNLTQVHFMYSSFLCYLCFLSLICCNSVHMHRLWTVCPFFFVFHQSVCFSVCPASLPYPPSVEGTYLDLLSLGEWQPVGVKPRQGGTYRLANSY